jgi:hypothetical protein
VRENASNKPETRHETASTSELRGELSLGSGGGAAAAFFPFFRSAFLRDLVVDVEI